MHPGRGVGTASGDGHYLTDIRHRESQHPWALRACWFHVCKQYIQGFIYSLGCQRWSAHQRHVLLQLLFTLSGSWAWNIKGTPPDKSPPNRFPSAGSRLQVQKITSQRMLQHLFSLTLVAVLSLLSSVSALNIPTLVNLRIEGSTTTIFEGPVLTFGHNVTTASGGNHHCDGTNNNQNPAPGPTCTSALDDASKTAHFAFDGYVS